MRKAILLMATVFMFYAIAIEAHAVSPVNQVTENKVMAQIMLYIEQRVDKNAEVIGRTKVFSLEPGIHSDPGVLWSVSIKLKTNRGTKNGGFFIGVDSNNIPRVIEVKWN